MCIFLGHDDPVKHTAEADIPIIKFLKIGSRGSLLSPYYAAAWKVGVIKSSPLVVIKPSPCAQWESYKGLYAYHPVLHADEIKLFHELLRLARPSTVHPYHGIVPRGASYYLGGYIGDAAIVASEMIILGRASL